MATLKEIAQEVGCSKTTVSLAMRGPSPKVSEPVRKQILKTAEKLSYIPHFAAKQLAVGKSGFIGIYMLKMAQMEVWISLAEQLLQRLNNMYKPILGISQNNNNIATANSWLQTFIQLNIEALIVMAHHIEGVKIPRRLNSKSPLWIGIVPPEKPVQYSYIALDRISATRMAIEHLLSKGRKNILVAVSGLPNRYLDIAKLASSHGAEVEFYDYSVYKKHGIYKNNYEILKEHIYIATKLAEYVTSKSTKPDACFLGDSPTAALFINQLISKGVKVPDDIAVVGYDYSSAADFALVPLTTVEQPVDTIIEEAVDSVFSILQDGQNQVVRQKIIQHRLVVRQST